MLIVASWVYRYFSCNFMSSRLFFTIFWSSRGHFGISESLGGRGGGGFAIFQAKFPPSRPGVDGAPIRIALSRPGAIGIFSAFFCLGRGVPIDQGLFCPPVELLHSKKGNLDSLSRIPPYVQGWDDFLGGCSALFEHVSCFLSNSFTLSRIGWCWGMFMIPLYISHSMSVYLGESWFIRELSGFHL